MNRAPVEVSRQARDFSARRGRRPNASSCGRIPGAAMDVARRYRVEGRVQGVGFRFFVERAARQLGLAGYVKNLGDGRVEVYALGPPAELDDLKRRLEQGPRAARVERVLEEEAAVEERSRGAFTVEAGGGLW